MGTANKLPATNNVGCGKGCLWFLVAVAVCSTALIMCQLAPQPNFMRNDVCKKMEQVGYDYTRVNELEWDYHAYKLLQFHYEENAGNSEALWSYCEEHDRKAYWGFK